MTAAARGAEVRQDGAEGGETPAAEPWPEAGNKAEPGVGTAEPQEV